jgi:hypothetical protein
MTGDAEYMTRAQVADYIGVKPQTIEQYLSRGQIPAPDLVWLGTTLWLQDTITAWHLAKRPGRSKRLKDTPKRTKLKDIKPPETVTLPRIADVSSAGAFVETDPPTTVDVPAAYEAALQLRAEGFFVMSQDVINLAGREHGDLGWDDQQLRVRVMSKLRAISGKEVHA